MWSSGVWTESSFSPGLRSALHSPPGGVCMRVCTTVKRGSTAASAFTLSGASTSTREDKMVAVTLRLLSIYIQLYNFQRVSTCVIPFELPGPAVRKGENSRC